MTVAARRLATAACTAAALAGVAAPARAHTGHGPTRIEARGDALFGGLAFAPAKVDLIAGDTAQWTNVDDVAPHTATEDNGLWELTGASTGLLGGPPGFGPGEQRSRAFEAGTFAYHCAIHPAMRASVSVAPYAYVESRRIPAPKRRRGQRPPPVRFRPYVVASWATAAPERGLAFDVERRFGSRRWEPWKAATTATGGRFRGGKRGRVWEVRSRLRRSADPSKASGWSPVARVTVR